MYTCTESITHKCLPTHSLCFFNLSFFQVNGNEVPLPTIAETLAKVVRQEGYIMVDIRGLVVHFDGQSTGEIIKTELLGCVVFSVVSMQMIKSCPMAHWHKMTVCLDTAGEQAQANQGGRDIILN